MEAAGLLAPTASATTSSTSPAHSASCHSSSSGGATPTEFLHRWRQDGDGDGACALTREEEAAARAFLSVVNPWRSARGYEPLPWNSAVKFLMARKFHVERALVLYQQHELMRLREGLSSFDPLRAPLEEELKTGKFTILPGRDANGATLALFNAHRHDPAITTHRITLQVKRGTKTGGRNRS